MVWKKEFENLKNFFSKDIESKFYIVKKDVKMVCKLNYFSRKWRKKVLLYFCFFATFKFFFSFLILHFSKKGKYSLVVKRQQSTYIVKKVLMWNERVLVTIPNLCTWKLCITWPIFNINKNKKNYIWVC
jgi:hypothetical protein